MKYLSIKHFWNHICYNFARFVLFWEESFDFSQVKVDCGKDVVISRFAVVNSFSRNEVNMDISLCELSKTEG